MYLYILNNDILIINFILIICVVFLYYMYLKVSTVLASLISPRQVKRGLSIQNQKRPTGRSFLSVGD